LNFVPFGGKYSNYGDIAYYALKTGKEIDFVLNKFTAFEVKETAAETDLKNTAALSKKLGIEKNYVIGRIPKRVF
jgi:hypothetical protein